MLTAAMVLRAYALKMIAYREGCEQRVEEFPGIGLKLLGIRLWIGLPDGDIPVRIQGRK